MVELEFEQVSSGTNIGFPKCDTGLAFPCFVSREPEAQDRGATLQNWHSAAAGAEISGPREDRGQAHCHTVALEVVDISPRNLDSSLCFFQPSVSHDILSIEVKAG